MCPQQVAKSGEDYAMLNVSRQVLGAYKVLSDCKGTLSYCRVRSLVVGAGNSRANLWEQVALNEDFPKPQFKHTTGHATVLEGVLSDFEATGNSAVDALAKREAVHNMPEDERANFARGCRRMHKLL
eukprot:477913-Pyramimonas_sp.AAC.1